MTTRKFQLDFNRLVVAIMLLGLLAMAVRVATDSDTWWQLRAGAWMVEHGRVMDHDEFTSVFAGLPYTYPAWLSQIVFYMWYQALGYAGVNLLTGLAVVAAFALVYAATTGDVYVRVAAVLLGATASAVFWAARPHMFSLVLAAAYLLILHLYRRQGRNYLWLLPPLMALWANVHPGFAIGFIMLGMVTAGEAWRALLGQQRWRAVFVLGGIGLLCVAALLVSPFGPQQLLYPFRVVSISTLQDRIQEWQSPNFHLREAQVFILVWLLTLAAVGNSRQPVDPTDFVLFAGTTYLALLAGRNLALFALVAPPILSQHGTRALAALRQWPGLARWQRPPTAPAAPLRHAGLFNWLILGLVALAVLVKVLLVSDPTLNEQLTTRSMPVGAVDYLAANHLPGRLYNPYEWGGYLEWRLDQQYDVFVDGRTDLYPNDFLVDYLRLSEAHSDWQALLDKYDIRVMLAPAGTALAELVAADPAWTTRYADERAVVLTRP